MYNYIAPIRRDGPSWLSDSDDELDRVLRGASSQRDDFRVSRQSWSPEGVTGWFSPSSDTDKIPIQCTRSLTYYDYGEWVEHDQWILTDVGSCWPPGGRSGITPAGLGPAPPGTGGIWCIGPIDGGGIPLGGPADTPLGNWAGAGSWAADDGGGSRPADCGGMPAVNAADCWLPTLHKQTQQHWNSTQTTSLNWTHAYLRGCLVSIFFLISRRFNFTGNIARVI